MEGVDRQAFSDLDKEVGEIHKDLSALKNEVSHINININKLVTQSEFFPVKVIVYGLVAGTMGAVLTAVLGMVFAK